MSIVLKNCLDSSTVTPLKISLLKMPIVFFTNAGSFLEETCRDTDWEAAYGSKATVIIGGGELRISRLNQDLKMKSNKN